MTVEYTTVEGQTNKVTHLRTEADIAKDMRERYWNKMREAADIMNEARRQGMRIEFAGIQCDQMGQHFVGPVSVVKYL